MRRWRTASSCATSAPTVSPVNAAQRSDSSITRFRAHCGLLGRLEQASLAFGDLDMPQAHGSQLGCKLSVQEPLGGEIGPSIGFWRAAGESTLNRTRCDATAARRAGDDEVPICTPLWYSLLHLSTAVCGRQIPCLCGSLRGLHSVVAAKVSDDAWPHAMKGAMEHLLRQLLSSGLVSQLRFEGNLLLLPVLLLPLPPASKA